MAEANQKADQRLKETKVAPFLDLGEVQLQIAFTAEESKITEGKLELKPWVASMEGGRIKGRNDAIVHPVTVSLVPATVKFIDDIPPVKQRAGFRVRAALAKLILPEAQEAREESAIRRFIHVFRR